MVDIPTLNKSVNEFRSLIESNARRTQALEVKKAKAERDAVKKNQKITVNEDVTKNTNENGLPEESKDINTNTNTSENVPENKSNVTENITASTQENVKNKNIENENTQKEIVKADIKEVEKNNELTSNPKQTDKS